MTKSRRLSAPRAESTHSPRRGTIQQLFRLPTLGEPTMHPPIQGRGGLRQLRTLRSLNWGGEGKVLLRCDGVTEEGADTPGTGPGGDRVASWTRWSWRRGPHPRADPRGRVRTPRMPRAPAVGAASRACAPGTWAAWTRGELPGQFCLTPLPSHRRAGFPGLPGREVTAVGLNFIWTEKEARNSALRKAA
ncbi:hypothetical protein NN561_015319 [Cricetulus griseus]